MNEPIFSVYKNPHAPLPRPLTYPNKIVIELLQNDSIVFG
jgi:hypothetical protein